MEIIYIAIFCGLSSMQKKEKKKLSGIIWAFMILGHWPNEQNVRQWSGKPGCKPRSSHTKDSKMVLDDALLNTLHYKVSFKGKME